MEADIGKTPYIRFDLNDYSVPATATRRSVTVVPSLDRVRVFDGTELIAEHARSWDRRQTIENPAHIAALADAKRAAREHRGLDRLLRSAPSVAPPRFLPCSATARNKARDAPDSCG